MSISIFVWKLHNCQKPDFTSQFEKLPPITYSVELNPTKARETLEEKGVKVTTFTSQGKMPLKDEKLDVVVNE